MNVFPELNESFAIRSIWNVARRFEFFLDIAQYEDVAAGRIWSAKNEIAERILRLKLGRISCLILYVVKSFVQGGAECLDDVSQFVLLGGVNPVVNKKQFGTETTAIEFSQLGSLK